MRLLSKRMQLWTEMYVDDTLLHNLEPEKCEKFLGYDPVEHPVVCQLGGSDPVKLAEAAKAVEKYGYDEVNLNVGCPSDRVSTKGEFGCSLMKRPDLVKQIITSVQAAVSIPVTVKCRLGVDEFDSEEFTKKFVRTVAESGCTHFIIHARKAWLLGLSPTQNRSIPPLMYRRVLNLCYEFPHLQFSINGGINDLSHARALLGFPGTRSEGETDELIAAAWDWREAEHGTFPGVPKNLLGVMIGRGAMNNPSMLWDTDRAIYGEAARKPLTRRQLLEEYCEYLDRVHPPGDTQRSVGVVHLAVKPTLGVYCGIRGNKVFRATLDVVMRTKENRDRGPGFCIREAMRAVEEREPGVSDFPIVQTELYKPPKEQVAKSEAKEAEELKAAEQAAAAVQAKMGKKRRGQASGDKGEGPAAKAARKEKGSDSNGVEKSLDTPRQAVPCEAAPADSRCAEPVACTA
eukprot:TRINITY_DN60132_c0_g2_i2.p1 TRINITY_DN60132_c0_g2~~TRINITY_DN60132_c0_g2_i2.p1  ORF type:complete len:459 (+),score=105.30 TRINITY_DN60132_c0_g2_i2:284-1660(+)